MNANIHKTKDTNAPGFAVAALKLISFYNGGMDAVQRLKSLIGLRDVAPKICNLAIEFYT